MRAVEVRRTLRATVHEAESCWYDVAGWPAWVEGLAEVVEVADGWPAVGARVVWRSGPAGRGTVTERVVEHVPLEELVVEVEDDSIRGRQSISFTPAGDQEVEMVLRLEYELKDRSWFAWMADPLFIRRAMRASLADTLARFGAELEGARRRRVG